MIDPVELARLEVEGVDIQDDCESFHPVHVTFTNGEVVGMSHEIYRILRKQKKGAPCRE